MKGQKALVQKRFYEEAMEIRDNIEDMDKEIELEDKKKQFSADKKENSNEKS